MDTSSPAVFVNAELLRTYVGQKVRAVVQVIGFDGGVVTGKSVDDQQLIIKGSPHLFLFHEFGYAQAIVALELLRS
ncbi:Replication protein A 14 kDa subunit B [Vitis vinifera]|uniref:Replication protein A 14 kDa subunit B n=1 Tax=Vitis vinifera TaxID=29760 RepID=A0A438FV73_VITVI|nr:Replication protein A 14 kDa subunit B [Vitis vinifera]